MSERMKAMIQDQNRARRFVSEHSKGPGSVGRGQPDDRPVVTSTMEVEGQTVTVLTNDKRAVKTKGHATLALTDEGKIVVIPGKMKGRLSVSEVNKILNPEQSADLKSALFEDIKKKGTPSHIVGR